LSIFSTEKAFTVHYERHIVGYLEEVRALCAALLAGIAAGILGSLLLVAKFCILMLFLIFIFYSFSFRVYREAKNRRNPWI
jgi:hypothetical protein